MTQNDSKPCSHYMVYDRFTLEPLFISLVSNYSNEIDWFDVDISRYIYKYISEPEAKTYEAFGVFEIVNGLPTYTETQIKY